MEKKVIKKDINFISGGILLYNLIMFSIVVFDFIVQMILYFIMHPEELAKEEMSDEVVTRLSQSGSSSIVAIIIGVLVLFLYFHFGKRKIRFFQNDRRMTVRFFLLSLVMLMSTQMLYSALAPIYEAGLNLFQYTAKEAIESPSEMSTTVSMFLYASLLGPLAEELVYRGFVMQNLKKYGKVFAIVFSSVLFGVMHGNMMQSIYAFFAGLVFGYVAMEFSLIWSVILHMINNMLFGDLLSYLLTFTSTSIKDVVYIIINIGFFVGGMLILFIYRERIRDYLQTHKPQKGWYRYAFTSICTILFIIIEFAVCLMGISEM